MNFQQLRSVREAVRRGFNLTEVAQALHTSQPGVSRQIRELEDEIDVAEGRLRFIDDRVNYSTLNLNLYKEKVRSSATSKIGFGSRFIDSLTEGWNSFVSFMLGIISLWPFFLLVPIIIFLWRKWRSGKKNKN